MKKIIVFGATGSVGVYLTGYLKNYLDPRQYQLIAVGRRKTSFFDKLEIPYISMAIDNPEEYAKLPQEDVYAAIHLANMLPARMEQYDPVSYIHINTLGTLLLLEYLRKTHGDRILFTQTYADLGGHFGHEIRLGNHLPRKLNFRGDHAVYAISKCAAVDLMEHYHQEYGIGNFVFRLPNIYMYSPEKYYFVDGKETLISYRYLIARAMSGEPLELWGDPDLGRDIVYVKDLCQMMALALTSGRDTGTYNAGTGVMTTMRQQIEGIIDVFCPPGRKSAIIERPEKRNSMQYVMDIENAEKELGYRPKYDYAGYLRDYKTEMNSGRFAGL